MMHNSGTLILEMNGKIKLKRNDRKRNEWIKQKPGLTVVVHKIKSLQWQEARRNMIGSRHKYNIRHNLNPHRRQQTGMHRNEKSVYLIEREATPLKIVEKAEHYDGNDQHVCMVRSSSCKLGLFHKMDWRKVSLLIKLHSWKSNHPGKWRRSLIWGNAPAHSFAVVITKLMKSEL